MLNEKIQEKINQKLPVRLHLGCGSVKMEGYLNVDGDYMSHDPEVTIQDITKPFPILNNTVDEILTVHVIEHISRQHIPPMFKEFYRICKIGGSVAIEWPDLLKMCQEVVNNPDCFWTHDKRLTKRTISGIYGDSARYPDPTISSGFLFSLNVFTNKKRFFLLIKRPTYKYFKSSIRFDFSILSKLNRLNSPTP